MHRLTKICTYVDPVTIATFPVMSGNSDVVSCLNAIDKSLLARKAQSQI